MKKKFIVNLILLLFLNFLIKPFWIFGIDRSVQNIAGAEEYGLYFSLLSFSLLLNILLDIGITNFNNRAIARNHNLLDDYLSNIFVLKFLLGLIYLLISFVIAFAIGYNERQVTILFFLAINQFLNSFILYLRSNISGLQMYITDSFLSVLDKTLMILFCSIILWGNFTGHIFRIEWFVYAQTLSYIITAAIVFLIVLSKSHTFRIKLDFKNFYYLLVRSFPFAILVFLMACYNRIDSVMLERMLPNGKEQAGIYAQAYRILDALTMFGFLFAQLLLPMFARMLKTKEPVGSMVQLSYTLIIVPALTFAVLAFFFGTDIMNLMYKEHVASSSNLFGLLMIGFAGISTTYIFGTLLTANGNLRQLNLMALTGVAVNVVLNYILIPRYFALGSAIASMVTQIYTAVFQVILSQRLLNLKVNYRLISRLSVFTLILISAGVLVKQSYIHWYYELAIVALISASAAFGLKLIHPQEFLAILKDQPE